MNKHLYLDITDCIVAYVPFVIFGSLKYKNKITKSLWATYLWGICIGCLWEIPFGLAGDSFLVSNSGLGFGIHITNAFVDSLIFVFGLYFIHMRNNGKYCGLLQLLLMIIWGIFQEFMVEYMFGHSYWEYRTDNKYNQVLFTMNGEKYTYIPFLVWLLSPILYLSGVFSIIEKWGSLNKKDNLQDITLDLLDAQDKLYIDQLQIGPTII